VNGGDGKPIGEGDREISRFTDAEAAPKLAGIAAENIIMPRARLGTSVPEAA